MSAHTIYKELFPPQTVEHAEKCHFTDPTAVNIVVAKASLLQIYEFVEYIPGSIDSDTADSSEDDESNRDTDRNDDEGQSLAFPKLKLLNHGIAGSVSGRLELVAQYKLNGTIASMGVVRTPTSHGKQGYDSLLLGFEDAKMSLIEWSVATNAIETVSIHYYEREEPKTIKNQEREESKREHLSNPYPPSIHVDPQQRCAVLNFYNNQISILPFRPTNAKLSSDGDSEAQSKQPYSSSILVDLMSIETSKLIKAESKEHARIKNVIDMTFLSGYNAPTLAILFQTEQTWTGRLSSVKDTVSMVAIELDLTQNVEPDARQHTAIYFIDKLPYDSFKLVPLPKPVDGTLVICANSLLHVSHGQLGIGAAVNGYTRKTTDFPGMIYDDTITKLGLALEGAHALPLGGTRCLLFLQNGDWAVIHMKMDGSKVVGINVTCLPHATGATSGGPNSPAVVIPTCATAVKEGEYFFLGSRAGDSQLIKWRHSRDLRSSMPTAANDFTFRTCDTLMNTGPIVDMAIGNVESTKESEEAAAIPDLELVSCSGHGKNGCLSIFHRHVRPTTVPTIIPQNEQNGCQAIWSLKYRKQQYVGDVNVHGNVHEDPKSTKGDGNSNGHWGSADTENALESSFDRLLFISKPDSTFVYRLLGEEWVKFERNNFYKKGPTIAVSTLFDYTRIVQVYASKVILLLPEGKLSQDVPIRESRVVDASIHDPYIILTLENDSMLVLYGDENTQEMKVMKLPAAVNGDPVAFASVFADVSGLFSTTEEYRAKRAKTAKPMHQASNVQDSKRETSLDGANATINTHSPTSTGDAFDDIDMYLYGDQVDPDEKPVEVMPETTSAMDVDSMDVDDEDMLYGSSEPAAASESNQDTVDETNVSMLGDITEPIRVSYWCMVYTKNGTLKIYCLPDFSECFAFPRFGALPSLVVDHPVYERHSTESANSIEVKEIVLANIGKERKDPHLVARTSDEDIIIYKPFNFVSDEASKDNDTMNRLALRFSRVHHNFLPRRPDPSEVDPEDADDTDLLQRAKVRRHALIPFSNIAGYNGVFVAGKQPAWLMCSSKSFVRVHPMKANHEVVGFTQFHSATCKHGFITVDTKPEDSIKLCNLPTDGVTYDLDWIVRKQPLGQTPHKIKYHPIMHVYAVLVSRPERVRLEKNEEKNDEKNEDNVTMMFDQQDEREPSEFLPHIERYQMLMISPVTWETVRREEFQEYEQAMSLECLQLETDNKKKEYYMVVGIGYLRGEHTAMRGCVYIYKIIEVVPEPDNPQTNHNFKLIKEEEQKGAVTALCEVSFHLVCCCGPKVFVYRFEGGEELTGVAFIDVEIYVTSVCSIKNYILLGDAQKSICFLGFQLVPENKMKLVLLGKDYQSMEVATVNYLINDGSLYFIVSDMDDNLNIFQYAPGNFSSYGGQKLIRRGDIHVNSGIQSMLHLPQITIGSKGLEFSEKHHLCLCGSLDGSISVVYPLSEKTFKRLNALYGQLVNVSQHIAGLNPRAYRLIKGPKRHMPLNRAKAVLDGDIIFRFSDLGVATQRDVARHIGSTVPRIVENLVDIENSIRHF